MLHMAEVHGGMSQDSETPVFYTPLPGARLCLREAELTRLLVGPKAVLAFGPTAISIPSLGIYAE